jgi:hypothetical protein
MARDKEQNIMDLERLVMEHMQVFEPQMAGAGQMGGMGGQPMSGQQGGYRR